MNSALNSSTLADRLSQLMARGLLPFAWCVAIVAALALAITFQGKTEFFYGIADTREQVVSFQYPVEIVQVHAVEGKAVAEGQAVLEVRRHDLALGQQTLDEKLRRFDLEKKEATHTMGSQVQNLVAKRDAAMADLDAQIHALERKLRALESVSGGDPKLVTAESIELADLQQKRRFTHQAISADINNLRSQLGGASRPIDAQIAELQKTRTETQRQVDALKVGALFAGRVGSVNFRVGELVPAFQAILTVHSLAPRDIKGYVHENVLNDVKVGQTVWVKAIAPEHGLVQFEATVEGLGNRIVEYPLRLRRNQAVAAYGREVVVRLKDERNPLLFGEKVEVALALRREWPNLLGSAHAKALRTPTPAPLASPGASDDAAHVLASLNPQIPADTVEASGLWWNAKESHYLMVSDESHGNGAAIFIVNADMRIERRMKMLRPIDIDDLESISSDGEYVYVLSSLAHNKQGQLKAKRKQLLRLRYQGDQVTAQQDIDLHAVLVALSLQQPATALSQFLAVALRDKEVDIESHFVKGGKLYLGFKSPQTAGATTVIAEIDNVSALFAGQHTHARVWREVALVDTESGVAARLSDMAWVDDRLLMLGVTRGSPKSSQLWMMDMSASAGKDGHDGPKATLLKRFKGVAAEGLAYRPDNATLTVVFDEGQAAASKYQSMAVSDLPALARRTTAAGPAAPRVSP
jgi:multidrug resistance efflux pump